MLISLPARSIIADRSATKLASGGYEENTREDRKAAIATYPPFRRLSCQHNIPPIALQHTLLIAG